MSNKKDKYKINYSTYVSGGRAMGNSGSAIRGGLSSAFSRVKSTSNKENTSSNKSSSGGVSGLIKSSVGSTVTSNKSSNSYDSSSKSNTNLDYNVKKYMGQRGGTFGDKSYTKIGDDFYLKANPYSGIDMKKNNKPKLLKENQYNVSEENREKINKGRVESYIKGINPYSAPPKNIRDAKAKESVESLMNSIQKRKNEAINKGNSLLKTSTLEKQRDNMNRIKNVPLNVSNIKADKLGYGFKENNTTDTNKLTLNNNINSIIKPMNNKSMQNKNLLSIKEISKNVNNYGFNQDNKKNILSSKNSHVNESNDNSSIMLENEKMKNSSPFLQNKSGFNEKTKSINKVYDNANKVRKATERINNISDLTIKNINNKINKQNEEIYKQKELEKQKNKKVANVGDFRQYIENIGKLNKNPVYGSKMSINDVNLLNKKYDDFIKATPYEAQKYKDSLWAAFKIKTLYDYYNRKKYQKDHTTTAIPKSTIDSIMNNAVDYGNYKDAIPDDIIGKNKIEKIDNMSDKQKAMIVEKFEKKYGGENIEKNLKKYGGENLAFDNPLALSTNPAFRNQSVEKIQNMSIYERKIAFIISRENGQKAADIFMNYLSSKISPRNNLQAMDLTENSLASLYGFATVDDMNGRIDNYKTKTRSIFGMDNPEYNDSLNYAVSNKKKNGTALEKLAIKAAEEQNDLILKFLYKVFGF
ncbi:hypothetical protein [Anaerofustis butyriciformans]|uniref:hypothetical protein n=1 Tax=Anaerofustis butyriciformans TaxID=3108533 RepID=UPI002E375F89|nr:hypothetical protein [Anaerofustis sp. HA2171]